MGSLLDYIFPSSVLIELYEITVAQHFFKTAD